MSKKTAETALNSEDIEHIVDSGGGSKRESHKRKI